MTDIRPPDGPADETEQLLRGADRPRPLPPALRARLAERLRAEPMLDGVEAGTRPEPAGRELPTALRARLEEALPGEARGAEVPSGGARAGSRRPRWLAPVSAAAAAALLAAAVTGLTLHGGGSAPAPVAASGSSHSPQVPRRASAGPANGLGGSTTAGGATAGSPFSASGGTAAVPAPQSASTAAPAQGGAGSGGPLGAALTRSPEVSAVAPATGPVAGGTWVVVNGHGLGGATAVRFGGVAATRVTVVSDGEVRALSPAHAAGAVDVVVVTPAGTTPAGPADRFTYQP